MKPSKRVGRPAIDSRDPSVPCTVRLPSKTVADLAGRNARRDGPGVTRPDPYSPLPLLDAVGQFKAGAIAEG
jgi:hypothetical protein